MSNYFKFLKDKHYWVGVFYTSFSCALIIAFMKIVFGLDSKTFIYIFVISYCLITFNIFYNLALIIFKSNKPRRRII